MTVQTDKTLPDRLPTLYSMVVFVTIQTHGPILQYFSATLFTELNKMDIYVSGWWKAVTFFICLLPECLSTEFLTFATYPILLVRFWLIILTVLVIDILTLVAFYQRLQEIPLGTALTDSQIAIWIGSGLDLPALLLFLSDKGMDSGQVLPR